LNLTNNRRHRKQIGAAVKLNQPVDASRSESPAGAGLFFEAAEGIRTLDLLHGKQTL
jgi:hypothetical protein